MNNYTSFLRWHLPLCDLNPTDSTYVDIYRGDIYNDPVKIASIVFGPPSAPHHDPNWECDEVITVDVKFNGSELQSFKGNFIGLDETGQYYRMEYCRQDSLQLVYDAKSHKRQLSFKRYGYKSWFAFADHFNSPKLTEPNIPTSYTYSVKMKGFPYYTLENNADFIPGEDGKLYSKKWHEPEEFTCPDVVLSTVNAYPTLHFDGLYSYDDILEDITREKDVTAAHDSSRKYTLKYRLDTESLMQQGYDAETPLDKKYFISKVELREYDDGEYKTVATYELPNTQYGRSGIGTFNIQPEFTVKPGNKYITVTHSEFRNDFGSAPIIIPDAPELKNDAISQSYPDLWPTILWSSIGTKVRCPQNTPIP